MDLLVREIRSQFHSVFENGESGLRDPLPSEERCILDAMPRNFEAMRRIFRESVDANDISRIEMFHQPESGVIGMVVFSRLLRKGPVLYLRSVRYDVECGGRNLGDEVLERCSVPARLYRVQHEGLRGCYYTAVFSREACDQSGWEDILVDPGRITDEWRLYLDDRTPVVAV